MKILLSEDQVRAGIHRLAGEINQALGPAPLTVVGVLTGSLVLLADLIRLMEMPLRVGLLPARSYRGETTRGRLELETSLLPDLAAQRVLLLDDIFDTGHTLREVRERLRQRDPESVHTAVLLRKHGRQEVTEQPDFVGFEIPNQFVVGYGLDYRELYRNLPCIAVLEPDDLVEDSA